MIVLRHFFGLAVGLFTLSFLQVGLVACMPLFGFIQTLSHHYGGIFVCSLILLWESVVGFFSIATAVLWLPKEQHRDASWFFSGAFLAVYCSFYIWMLHPLMRHPHNVLVDLVRYPFLWSFLSGWLACPLYVSLRK